MVDVSGRHRPDYERSDIDSRLVALLALGGAAFLIVTPYVLGVAYPLARHEPAAGTPPAIPAPRLQIDPTGDLQALRAAEDARLSRYGWIDRANGIVRLPIDRAMQLTAQRGLAGWPRP